MNNFHRIPVFWLLPDPHFHHTKLIKENIRPENYQEQIIKFICTHVKDNDVIICLGDYLFYKGSYWHEKFMGSTPCPKWITLGNHDRETINWYINNGFSAVATEIKLTIYRKVVLLSHMPVYERNDFDLNIHAHIHQGGHRTYRANKKHINLYLEHHYTLFNLRSVIDNHSKLGYYDCSRKIQK